MFLIFFEKDLIILQRTFRERYWTLHNTENGFGLLISVCFE